MPCFFRNDLTPFWVTKSTEDAIQNTSRNIKSKNENNPAQRYTTGPKIRYNFVKNMTKQRARQLKKNTYKNWISKGQHLENHGPAYTPCMVFKISQSEKDARKVLANGAKREPEPMQNSDDKSHKIRCRKMIEKCRREAETEAQKASPNLKTIQKM